MKPSLPLLLVFLLCTCAPAPQKNDSMPETSTAIDWQGHRGCRGLLPENTIPAFLRALSYPAVQTLELDVVISADYRVIVSHEPWMSAEICLGPNGEKLSAAEEDRISLRSLTAEEIATYDCGQLPHPRFPEQAQRPAHKPTLAAVFAAVDRYCVQNQRPSPRYNIELKYEADLEPHFVPSRDTFVDLVLADIDAWNHPELVTLQCFDPPTLAIIHAKRPDLQLAYLDEFPGGLSEKMAAIGFTPPIYSPYEIHVDAALMAEAHALGMRVVPWTVNDTTRMRELLELGVAGIITDYPDRIKGVKEKGRKGPKR
ncbi:glycerophosphodiester phosphodiesterase family protein [Neolewinella lacunae]|uniref:Glycerophosphodiester phosphodiesterase n=2 Tax=Neolewinella lacunae TaxID=1517758 RepID=A0A923PKI6_9BACT|nr:glycerophosphodiester phosphodiesterase family protein [Neolewinella lacunae]MBC6994235.1 glycerophosphodiester phosphodiesterase [Neolewinella lacunae]MDN3637147.1 glycerophosphodiester phosphodiesterase family protein [Neolewinella lacunae]